VAPDPLSATSPWIEGYVWSPRAGRIESVDADGDHLTQYDLNDGDRWVSIGCTTSANPPDDSWLSIAETFEFLPAQE
jgi:hypothetical protein